MSENHNPNARAKEQVINSNLPQNVSAVTWKRPYEYAVIRVDDDRITRLDDHQKGRILSGGLHTRHTALNRKMQLEKNGEGEYIIEPVKNESYEDYDNYSY